MASLVVSSLLGFLPADFKKRRRRMRSKRFHRDRSLAVIICLVSTGRPASGPDHFF